MGISISSGLIFSYILHKLKERRAIDNGAAPDVDGRGPFERSLSRFSVKDPVNAKFDRVMSKGENLDQAGISTPGSTSKAAFETINLCEKQEPKSRK